MARNREADDPRRRTLVGALTLGLLGPGLWAPDAAGQIFGDRPGRLSSKNVHTHPAVA